MPAGETWVDKLDSFTGTGIDYDEIGNPLNWRDSMTFSWEYGRRLKSVTKGTDNISYTYDADGLRTSKTVNGTKTDYYWLDGVLQGQKTGNEHIIFLYDENGTAYGMLVDNNGTQSYYYYLFNLQGDVVGIMDSTGNTVVEYTYDAWGQLLSVTGDTALGNKNPIRYRGYYFDTETGFYLTGTRYYDPEIGRFINADDTAVLDADYENMVQYNLYAYCWNNPVNMDDQDGYWPKWATNLAKVAVGVVAIGIGVAATVATGGAAAPVLIASVKIAVTSAVIGAAVGAGTNAVSHRVTTGSWKGAVKAALSGAVDGAADGFMWGGISAGATFTTAAAKGIKIQQIGKLSPTNKSGKGYTGVQYKNQRGSLKSFELHSPHKGGPHQQWHWQQNTWNPKTGGITGKSRYWTLFGRRF